MEAPFKTDNEVTFTLVPKTAGTRVSWAIEGNASYLMKLMGVVLNMDKMMAREFDAGLADLKRPIAEAGAASSATHHQRKATSMNPVVHFRNAYDDKARAAQFYRAAFDWQMHGRLARRWRLCIGYHHRNGCRRSAETGRHQWRHVPAQAGLARSISIGGDRGG